MQTNFAHPRRIRSVLAIACALLSIAHFLLQRYVEFPFASGSFDTSVVLLMSASYTVSFLEGLFPVIIAVTVFLTAGPKISHLLIPASLLVFTKLFYTIPYYYVYFVSDVFNSIESLMYAFIVSLFYILYTFLQIIVCIFIFRHVESKLEEAKRERKCARLFDIDDHINFGILLSVLIPLIIVFVRTTIDTVTYLIDVAGNYRTEEILTIVLSYAVIVVCAFLEYTICAITKNLLIKKAAMAEISEEPAQE